MKWRRNFSVKRTKTWKLGKFSFCLYCKKWKSVFRREHQGLDYLSLTQEIMGLYKQRHCLSGLKGTETGTASHPTCRGGAIQSHRGRALRVTSPPSRTMGQDCHPSRSGRWVIKPKGINLEPQDLIEFTSLGTTLTRTFLPSNFSLLECSYPTPVPLL